MSNNGKLCQGSYFFVCDVNEQMDKLGTMERYFAPNVRKHEYLPVYAMGQPTKEGLANFIQLLKEDGHTVSVTL